MVFQSETLAAESCGSVFTSIAKAENKQGALLTHERDSKLHTSMSVEKNTERHHRITGVKLSKPAEKLDMWFAQLEKVVSKAARSDSARAQVKSIIYKQYAMKVSEIPESHYLQQAQIARNRGQGNVHLNETQRLELAQTVVKDQQRSLDGWVEYLVSKDTQVYPMWLKYWMFTGMTKLSKFDGETGTFGSRSKETVAPFIEVNHEALAYVADAVVRKVNKKSLTDIQDPAFLKALEGMNFGKLYGQALYKLGVGRDGYFATNEGRWVLYPRGSDHMPLVKSLEGRNTGWCTAGESTAATQLRDGDFYVYYSRDKNGEDTLPRVAIRMEGDQVGEVRGVAKEQNLDAQIVNSNIVSDKMKSFGDRGDNFVRKDADMKLLTIIEKKFRLGQELNKAEVMFVREIERPIKGFGWGRDPRIDEILVQRDKKEDYSIILDRRYSKDEIAMKASEFINNGGKEYKVLADNLVVLDPTQKMPEILMGDLLFMGLDSAEGMTFPRKVTGSVELNYVTKANNLKLPEEVGKNLVIDDVRQVEGLILPKKINGDFTMRSLKSAKSLKMPQGVRKYTGPSDIK
jgi:hypothetical protein